MKNTQTNSRRKFIKTTAAGTALAAISIPGIASMLSSCSGSKKISSPGFSTGFEQQPLPYKYDALENIIDAQTMEIHYSKHASGYSKNLKDAALAENVNMQESVEKLLSGISKYSAKMRNNAGGHYNHEMFWQCMRPKTTDNKPSGTLLEAIEKQFSIGVSRARSSASGGTAMPRCRNSSASIEMLCVRGNSTSCLVSTDLIAFSTACWA